MSICISNKDIYDVSFGQQHLLLDQFQHLFNVLSKHRKLFDGSFVVYLHKKGFVNLKPGAKLVHHHTHTVPHAHQQTLKKELESMVELGIRKLCRASEWESYAFIIPKKDGQVQQITNNIHYLSSQIC